MAPRLSLCMIVRDEEERLPRALACANALADEIVVCDTGSRDRSVEIALGLGARVIHFPWNEHFAQACNAAFDTATGDWILRLDADEWIAPEQGSALRALIAQENLLAVLVRLRERDATETMQPRLFRNRPDLRLRRRVRERFEPSLERIAAAEGREVVRSAIVVEHAPSPDKGLNALPLLERELQENPDDLSIAIELGRTLLTIGEARGHAVLQRPIARLLAAQGGENPPFPGADALLEYAFLFPEPAVLAGMTPEKTSFLAERWFPLLPDLIWHAAQADWIAARFVPCARRLERLRRILGADTGGAPLLIDPALSAERTALNLAACYLHLGRFAEAERLLYPLLDTHACAVAARRNLALLARMRRPRRATLRSASDVASEPRKTERPAGR